MTLIAFVAFVYPVAEAVIIAFPTLAASTITVQVRSKVESTQLLCNGFAIKGAELETWTTKLSTPELPFKLNVSLVSLPTVADSLTAEKAKTPGIALLDATDTVAEALATPGADAVIVAVPANEPFFTLISHEVG